MIGGSSRRRCPQRGSSGSVRGSEGAARRRGIISPVMRGRRRDLVRSGRSNSAAGGTRAAGPPTTLPPTGTRAALQCAELSLLLRGPLLRLELPQPLPSCPGQPLTSCLGQLPSYLGRCRCRGRMRCSTTPPGSGMTATATPPPTHKSSASVRNLVVTRPGEGNTHPLPRPARTDTHEPPERD